MVQIQPPMRTTAATATRASQRRRQVQEGGGLRHRMTQGAAGHMEAKENKAWALARADPGNRRNTLTSAEKLALGDRGTGVCERLSSMPV